MDANGLSARTAFPLSLLNLALIFPAMICAQTIGPEDLLLQQRYWILGRDGVNPEGLESAIEELRNQIRAKSLDGKNQQRMIEMAKAETDLLSFGDAMVLALGATHSAEERESAIQEHRKKIIGQAQAALSRLDYPVGTTGTWDDVTKLAVREFQTISKLGGDGVLTIASWIALGQLLMLRDLPQISLPDFNLTWAPDIVELEGAIKVSQDLTSRLADTDPVKVAAVKCTRTRMQCAVAITTLLSASPQHVRPRLELDVYGVVAWDAREIIAKTDRVCASLLLRINKEVPEGTIHFSPKGDGCDEALPDRIYRFANGTELFEKWNERASSWERYRRDVSKLAPK